MEQLYGFFTSNAENILSSLLSGLLLMALTGGGIWAAGKRIRLERLKQAKNMLIDLVEGMIVNNEVITNPKLRQFFSAVERELNISISTYYDLPHLFEDVLLRFQRSKHLDASQKNEYSDRIAELSLELMNDENFGIAHLAWSNDELFDELESLVDHNPQLAAKLRQLRLDHYTRFVIEEQPSLGFWESFRIIVEAVGRTTSPKDIWFVAIVALVLVIYSFGFFYVFTAT